MKSGEGWLCKFAEEYNIPRLCFVRQEFDNWGFLNHYRDSLGSVVGVVAAYRGNLKFEHQQRRKNLGNRRS
jgi:hypothetical protein